MKIVTSLPLTVITFVFGWMILSPVQAQAQSLCEYANLPNGHHVYDVSTSDDANGHDVRAQIQIYKADNKDGACPVVVIIIMFYIDIDDSVDLTQGWNGDIVVGKSLVRYP